MQNFELNHIRNDFLEYESSHHLFEKHFGDFQLWTYLRFELYQLIINKETPYSTINKGTTKIKKPTFAMVLAMLKYILIDSSMRRIRRSDILIFNSNRKTLVGQRYQCIYTNPLLDQIPWSYSLIEEDYHGNHASPSADTGAFYLDRIKFGVKLRRRLFKNRYYPSHHETEEIRIWIKPILEQFGIADRLNNVLAYINDIFSYRKAIKSAFQKILRKVKPKVIVEVVSYNLSKLILNECAHEMGVPIIELQHGTMGSYHIAYNFKDNVRLKSFPDYLLLFSSFWKETTSLPIAGDNIRITGFPHIERTNPIKDVQDLSSKKTILCLSQPTIAQEMISFVTKLSTMLDHQTYRIVYKLHPFEYDGSDDIYQKLKVHPEIITIGSENKKSLYELFSEASYQLGVYSTAIFEGLYFRLPTFILQMKGFPYHLYMQDLFDKGFATLVDDPKLLLSSLLSANIDEKLLLFWENDSLNKIIHEMKAIIG